MQGNLLNQGVELLVFGMGTVVVFLTLLVGATSLMSQIVSRFFPVDEEEWAAAGTSAANSSPAPVDPRLVSVITAAVHQHRRRRDV